MWKWRIYLPHQYRQVEAWLADMSLQGWRLVEYRRFRFRFYESEPKVRRFRFLFGMPRGNINAIGWEMKSRSHALEVPSGRCTQAKLLVLPAPEKAAEDPKLLAERQRLHGIHFLLTGMMWFLLTFVVILNTKMQWIRLVLTCPCILFAAAYWYAAIMEMRK